MKEYRVTLTEEQLSIIKQIILNANIKGADVVVVARLLQAFEKTEEIQQMPDEKNSCNLRK